MKKYLIPAALAAMLLAGCANTPVVPNATPAQAAAQTAANLQTHQYQLCLFYHGAHATIAQKLQTLPQASANTLYGATQQATKLCSTVLTNDTQAATQLTQAFTTIAVMAGIQQLAQ